MSTQPGAPASTFHPFDAPAQGFEDECRNAEAREILDHGLAIGIPGELRAFIEERIARRGGV